MFRLDRKIINLFHMAVIAPFLLYVGYLGFQGEAIPDSLFQVMLAAGALAALYHGLLYFGFAENMIVTSEKEEEIVPIQ